MTRRLSTLILLVLALATGTRPAHAQRGSMRNGKVYTPYGLAYDTSSPEWRMAGGNIEVYQQIMAQKAYAQRMQQLQKAQKQMLAQQRAQRKAFETWAKEHPEEHMRWQAQQQMMRNAPRRTTRRPR
jgi:hypothetical protein